MAGLPLPPPPPEISPPQVVIVVGWLVTASMIVAACTRLGTKISLKRLLSVDDYLVVVATVIGSVQMGVTYRAARLSLSGDTLTGKDWDDFQKSLYSSQLLFVPTICLAKLSVLHSLHQITPVREHKGPIIAFASLVGLMLLAFQFATAFQCSEPFWSILSGNCFDQTPFWQAWGALDVITDAFIVIFPIYIVATLQMGTRFKVVVAGVFGTRVATIAAAICRLVYLTRTDGKIQADFFLFWAYILNTEIQQGLSIITACVPFLKPFFESLETGMLAPSHGLTIIGGSAGSGNRSKKSHLSSGSYKLRSNPDHGINVSRRISTHSDECGLVKEGASTWVEPVPPSRI